MSLSKRPELTQYLPPDLVVEATKQLKETLSAAVNNPELSLLELFAVFVIQELNFRKNVIPVGEAETAKLDQLSRDLQERISEAAQRFGGLATQVDNQNLLTARDKFKEETGALQQRLGDAKTTSRRTQEIVEALIKDTKSGRVILGSVAGLEKKGADLPAIVAGALLRSLFEPEEGTTTGITAAGADFITASRQAVVESGSRRAELLPPAEVETVVRIPRRRKDATERQETGRFDVKSTLEQAGIDVSGLKPIDFAHAVRALPKATKELFGEFPTLDNLKATLLTIARQEVGPDEFGGAESLKKLYDLGDRMSETPPVLVTDKSVAVKGKRPEELKVATLGMKTSAFSVREKTPLAAVFNFKNDGRWDAGNWGRLAHHTKGTPRTYDRAGRESRTRLKGEMEEGLPTQIDLLLTKCKSLGINTVSQLAAADAIKMPAEMKSFLTELITPTAGQQSDDLPVDVLAKIPQIMNIPDGTPTKPTRRDELLTMMRKQKR